MIYSKQLPSKPGWYWCKQILWGREFERVLEVTYLIDGYAVLGFDYVYKMSAEWAGPLDKPSKLEDIIS